MTYKIWINFSSWSFPGTLMALKIVSPFIGSGAVAANNIGDHSERSLLKPDLHCIRYSYWVLGFKFSILYPNADPLIIPGKEIFNKLDILI